MEAVRLRQVASQDAQKKQKKKPKMCKTNKQKYIIAQLVMSVTPIGNIDKTED